MREERTQRRGQTKSMGEGGGAFLWTWGQGRVFLGIGGERNFYEGGAEAAARADQEHRVDAGGIDNEEALLALADEELFEAQRQRHQDPHLPRARDERTRAHHAIMVARVNTYRIGSWKSNYIPDL